jgi:2-dehydro-3-deoxyglucarate aldolase/4-hydroxy-2-oxoheptanedioate aldolase
MATKGTETATLVRVPWNSPALIKPVVDLGASGVIVPMVRSAREAAAAISACRYPPGGIRGFGPLRASNYGRINSSDFCEESDRTLMTLIQIEHIEAVENLDSILKVPSIQDIVIGPNDLAASMGHLGDIAHPDVIQAMETIVQKACAADVNVGLAAGTQVAAIAAWARKGVRWFSLVNDVMLLLQTVRDSVDAIRTSIPSGSR